MNRLIKIEFYRSLSTPSQGADKCEDANCLESFGLLAMKFFFKNSLCRAEESEEIIEICSVRSTRWCAQNGIHWNGTRQSHVARVTFRSGHSTMVVCCTSGWEFSRVAKNPDTSPVWPSIKTVTFLQAIATAISQSGPEVHKFSIIHIN